MSFNTGVIESLKTNVSESTIEWKGYKPTGEHFGTIGISEGKLKVIGDALVSGNFTIDMKTIKILDSDNPKLLKHLKSADFFEVETFPISKFELTGSSKVEGKTMVKGFLTIKDIKKEISFPAKISKNKDGNVVLESETFKVNMADYNVKDKSKSFFDDLKDNFIYDEFDIKVKVVSSKN